MPNQIESTGNPKAQEPANITFGRRLLLLTLLLLSTSAAIAGQYFFNEEVMLQRLRSQPLPNIDPLFSAALPGVLFLILSGLLFALVCKPFSEPSRPGTGPTVRYNARSGLIFQLVAVGIGLGLTGYVAWVLLTGQYNTILPVLLIGALVAFGIALFAQDRRAGISFFDKIGMRWSHADIAGFGCLILLVGLFGYINIRDLADPFYAAIGDEYAFFYSAQAVALGGPVNLFSQSGVYGYHPLADTAYQAAIMSVFGIDYFGWKFSAVLLVMVSLVPLYFMARHFFGVFAAIAATIVAATSHYLFAYVHTGYNNVHALLPILLVAWATAVGISKRSPTLLFVAGACAGLGFYTFFSARLAVVALFLVLAATRPRLSNLKLMAAALLGFTIAVFPIFMVSKLNLLSAMVANSALKDSLSGLALVLEVAKRAAQSLLSFEYSSHRAHFITGSLLDPVSATLAAAAIFFAITRITDRRYRYVLIWLSVGLLVTGGFGWAISNETRLMVLVPFLAVLAGALLDRLVRVLLHLLGARRFGIPIQAVLLVVLVGGLLFLNLQRFWVTSPTRLQAKPESLELELVLAETTDHANSSSAVVATPGAYALTRPMFDSFDLGVQNPVLLDTKERLQAAKYFDAPLILIAGLSAQEEQTIYDQIKAKSPTTSISEKKDRSGITRIAVIRNPAANSATAFAPAGSAGLRATTKLGGPGKGPARLLGPGGVAVDEARNLYVTDTKNHRVQVFDTGGRLLRTFGGVSGSGSYLESPGALAASKTGIVAVLDTAPVAAIKFYDGEGKFLGSSDSLAKLNKPRGMAFDPKGTLYVADSGRILRFISDGQWNGSIASGNGADPLLLVREPADVATDSNDFLYFIDGPTGEITKIGPGDKVIAKWDTLARGKSGMPHLDIYPDGSVIVLLPEARQILRYSSTGQLLGTYNDENIIGERLGTTADLAIDNLGYIYISDTTRNQVVRFAFFE